MSKCKLCHQNKTLRKSHIISEFLYTPLYGASHKMRSVHAELSYVRFPSKGIREKLLCDDCELLIKKYEDYFSGVWFGDQGLPDVIPLNSNMVLKSGLDYGLFKLFHWSIIWRASVSTLDDFKTVALDKNNEEKLRLMLIEENPGANNEFSIGASIILIHASRRVYKGIIAAPVAKDNADYFKCSAIYAGCIWHCFLNDKTPIEMDTLQSDGTLAMAVFDFAELPGLQEFGERAKYARRKEF